MAGQREVAELRTYEVTWPNGDDYHNGELFTREQALAIAESMGKTADGRTAKIRKVA